MIELKYGCNPNQRGAKIYMNDGGKLPIEVLNGRPGYINFLDALNAWQLVRELKIATGLAAATSFKHVSPAGAAFGLPLDEVEKRACFTDGIEINHSPIACAYARARGADRMSSFGDFIALSDECDLATAQLIRREVSDGIIAPRYSADALEILRSKRNGAYSVIKIDEEYIPAAIETKQVFGVTFEQERNELKIDDSALNNIVTKKKILPPGARRDLLLALITLKYTQSNSVCYAFGGQTIGVGAGQQSRIHCTRLAGDKADIWHLRRHPKVLNLQFSNDVKRPDRDNLIDVFISQEKNIENRGEYLAAVRGVSLGSDAFFPFSDNIERARRSGVEYIAQPGGSVRDSDVITACDKYEMVMCMTEQRLFHH